MLILQVKLKKTQKVSYMQSLSRMIAWRYAIGSIKEKNIAIMIKLSFLSIFISSFALALIMAIMNGFEKATHEKIQGIHAQIIIRAHGQELDSNEIDKFITQEFPQIQATSPTSVNQVILQAQNSDDISHLVVLKAIDPARESKITIFDSKIIKSMGNKDLVSTVFANTIAIGQKMAEDLQVNVGDTINILFSNSQNSHSRKITLEQSSAKIGGIFSTGIDEFDSGLALSSIQFFSTLFPDIGITQINLKLKKNNNENEIIEQLKTRFNLEVYSWKELYPALVSALQLEKYAMFFILLLFCLVASASIISLLFMQITQKRGDIAMLKAMGMSNNNIDVIFIWLGMSIAFLASVTGLTCATIVSWLLEKYPLITLPDAYYVTHLPACMEWHMLIIVFIACMIISFIASWLPARRSHSINIAHILRFEA
jgi:lipoprotein-releasing system permease protein